MGSSRCCGGSVGWGVVAAGACCSAGGSAPSMSGWIADNPSAIQLIIRMTNATMRCHKMVFEIFLYQPRIICLGGIVGGPAGGSAGELHHLLALSLSLSLSLYL